MTLEEEKALESLSALAKGRTGRMDLKAACSILEKSCPGETLADVCACYPTAPDKLAQELGALVIHLALRLPTPLWPKADEHIRGSWPANLTKLPKELVPDPAAVLLGMCHTNGRTRAQAIAMSGILPPGLASALLLIRLNDWAEPVRKLAIARLAPILDSLSPSEKIAVVPLVSRLRECYRFLGCPWERTRREVAEKQIEQWLDRLATCLDPQSWMKVWANSKGPERKAYLDLLKRSRLSPSRGIRRALFESNDRAALLWYVHDILPGLEKDERAEATEQIRRSRAVPVRKLWLTRQIESDPERAREELVEALTNRSRSLRHFARYHLEHLAPMDFARHYQTLLEDPAQEPWALRGLSEVSPAAAHREALLRMESPLPNIRRAALECLDPETLGEHLDHILNEIGNMDSGVAKAARKRLSEIPVLLGAHLLTKPEDLAFFSTTAKLQLLRLAPFFGKWHGLEYLLRMDREVPTADLRGAWISWELRMGRSHARLDAAKQADLLRLLDRACLPEEKKEVLRFVLQKEH